VLIIARAMDMVIPHLGTKESCLFTSKIKRILVIRLSRNCLKQNFSKGLRPALVFHCGKQGHIFEACTKPKPP
jgi:hypothetical protein